MESSLRLRLSPIRAAASGHLTGHGIGGSSISSLGSSMAPGVVRGPSGSSPGGTSRAAESLELPRSASCQEMSLLLRDPLTSQVEPIQRIIRKAGFLGKVARVAAADLRCSTAALTGRSGPDSLVGVIDDVSIHARQLLYTCDCRILPFLTSISWPLCSCG